MAALPPARRVVTGHNANGKAIIEDDRTFEPFDPRALVPDLDASNTVHPNEDANEGHRGGFIHLWRTEEFPAKVQGPWTEYQNKHIPLSDKTGTTVRIVDIVPGVSSPMHRTVSLDFGIVLSGEVVLELDNGVETIVRAGDTVVQRGTIHAWHNRSKETSRILFVLVPSERVVVDGIELDKTDFVIN